MRALTLLVLSGLCCAWPSAAVAADGPRPVPFQKGITLAGWGAHGYPPAAMDRSLRQARAAGATWVTLLQVWVQDHTTSNRLAPGRQTLPDEDLLHAIRSAHAHGLRVLLRPYVDVRDGHWRGAINAREPDAWFASYSHFALRYARLAQEEGVGMFVLASEMRTMALRYPQRWSQLSAQVRAAYSGPVAYEANWDEVGQLRWLRSVDAVGISAYNRLCATPTLAVDRLTAAWDDWRRQLQRLQRRVGRPLLFTEVGYRPIRRTCLRPWDTRWRDPLLPAAQTAGYAATLRSWWRAPSWWRGLHWWAVHPAGPRPAPENHDLLPGAWRQLQRWYRRPARAEAGAPPQPPLPGPRWWPLPTQVWISGGALLALLGVLALLWRRLSRPGGPGV